MSFIENNKYFIFHSLSREMKGLTDTEKLSKYNGIKKEVRSRIKESYCKGENKVIFFLEIFEVLSFYEADYLMTNLFYETDAIPIINCLLRRKAFDGLIFRDPDSISCKYLAFIKSRFTINGAFKFEDELEFVRDNMINNIEELSEYDWKEVYGKGDSNSLITKYAKWLSLNLSNKVNQPKIFHTFISFTKMWNNYDIFFKPFNNTKAILFYTYIISEFPEGGLRIVELFEFVSKLKGIFSDMFVDIEYLPLLDNKNSINYRSGYLIKRKELANIFEQAEKQIAIAKDDSILNLFRSSGQFPGKIVLERLQSVIGKKIDNHELLNYNELIKIKELELNAEAEVIRDSYFERLYLFEFI